MAGILRGEVRWASLDPTIGHEQSGNRPVLILSRDVFNKNSGTVIAVALTSQAPRAGFPLTLEVDTGDLPKKSWIKISQIRTLSVERIGECICILGSDTVDQVVDGLNEIVGKNPIR